MNEFVNSWKQTLAFDNHFMKLWTINAYFHIAIFFL